MSSISPQDIKKLRDVTGAGFGDCKKALSLSNGDLELAKRKIKEMGISSADKRRDRDAKEGRVFLYSNYNRIGLLLVSCETDFVAMNNNFIDLGNSLVKELVESGKSFLDKSQELKIKSLAATVKENVQVEKIYITNIQYNEIVKGYLHGEPSRIGVFVKLKIEDISKIGNEALQHLATDLSLHIAAFAPIYLGKEDVPRDYIKEQEEIFIKQLESSGKPDNIVKVMVAGKINKHISEISLLDQSFVKNDRFTVSQILDEISKSISSNVKIVEFKYLRVG